MKKERLVDIEAREMAEEPYDASNSKQVNAARKKSARRNKKRYEVVNALMQHKDGRRWIYEILERCHIYTTSFVQGDPHATSFREGERNVGNSLLIDILTAAQDEYTLMMREALVEK